jgi:hypothetical protein
MNCHIIDIEEKSVDIEVVDAFFIYRILPYQLPPDDHKSPMSG